MIQFVNVSKIYGDKVVALHDINIKIEKGEFLFLVGPSGAGKSTFIRLLLREEEPTRGQILVGNRSINRLRRKEVALLRRNIGTVFQDFRLLSNRTVFENVAFVLEVLEYSRKDIRQKVPPVLEMVGLTSRKDSFPHQLSGGRAAKNGYCQGHCQRSAYFGG